MKRKVTWNSRPTLATKSCRVIESVALLKLLLVRLKQSNVRNRPVSQRRLNSLNRGDWRKRQLRQLDSQSRQLSKPDS